MPAEDADTTVGHYVWGAEVNAFRPCGVEEEYWVDGTPAVIAELREEYVSRGLAPYVEVLVEVRGEVGPPLDCGFCEAYQASFRVDELLRMELQGTTTCPSEP